MDSNLLRLLNDFIKAGSSDLHITTNIEPFVRLNGELVPLSNYQPVDGETIEHYTRELVGEKQYAEFLATNELDTALTLESGHRIRINIYRQQGDIAWALRLLPSEFFPLDKLGLPTSICEQACTLKKGLILVTGATGSGKSTTLASIINQINLTRAEHIFTIEDPVEYIHKPINCFISQREIGTDSASFHEALKRVLREDPDVVLIGEMRDAETMRAALTLAETGHLTFGTLHTSEAIQTVTRIIGAFPASEQEQIRTQLATTLQLVISQQLVPWDNGEGRSLAAETMVATPAIKAMIRENKIHQITSAMQTGQNIGMRTMNGSLAELMKSGKVSYENALAWSIDKEDMKRHQQLL